MTYGYENICLNIQAPDFQVKDMQILVFLIPINLKQIVANTFIVNTWCSSSSEVSKL